VVRKLVVGKLACTLVVDTPALEADTLADIPAVDILVLAVRTLAHMMVGKLDCVLEHILVGMVVRKSVLVPSNGLGNRSIVMLSRTKEATRPLFLVVFSWIDSYCLF